MEPTAPGAEPGPDPTMFSPPGDVPPRPPMLAYFDSVHALEATARKHLACDSRPHGPIGLRFSRPEDPAGIIAWSAKPPCLIKEMVVRGCNFDGLSVLADYAERTRCPQYVKDMPWGATS